MIAWVIYFLHCTVFCTPEVEASATKQAYQRGNPNCREKGT